MALLVLYGSETGTSQDLAEQIWREGYRRNVPVKVMSFDDFDMNTLPQQDFVIFLVSTSGQGELPANMRKNWKKLLNARIPSNWLDSLKIACFGLGDSSYQKYNFAAKKVVRRLLQLSANLVLPTVFGDDQHELGPYGLFDQFLAFIWKYLLDNSVFMNISEEPFRDYPFKYSLKFILGNRTKIEDQKDTSEDKCLHDYVSIKCLENKRITAENHFQDTRLISFDSSEHIDELAYQPGDVLMIQPRNIQSSIDIALKALGYSDKLLDHRFYLEPTDPNISKPPHWLVKEPTTLRHCFSDYFDLQMIPRRSFFATLAMYSKNEQERDRLAELSDMKNLDEYLAYCQRPRRTIAETLQDFYNTAKNMLPEILFSVLTPIRARPFSIASSPHAHPGQIQLLVAKVDYKAIRMVERRKGLCSTFLANLTPGSQVFVKIRSGTFHFDSKQSRILIGPGTGIAPFRSYVAELDFEPENHTQSVVFFGCRSQDKDYYFEKEWKNFADCTIFTAFSRPDDKTQKEYVQDKIKQSGDQLWQLLEDGKSQIFVAGRAKDMPDAVLEAIKEVVKENGAREDADEFMKELEKAGRIQFETWD